MDKSELSSIVSEAIAIGATHIERGTDLENLGEVFTGLAGLIELEQQLRRRNPDAIADELVAMGIKPHEFLHILRSAWQRKVEGSGYH